MTTALGIAATTAVLRRLLQNAIPSADLAGLMGTIDVTALPPDRIDVTNEKSQLNLFLYQVTPNPGWMNTDQPSFSFDGNRLTNPPLALDLHYMLSAYGEKDLFGEMLLGYAAMVLHQTQSPHPRGRAGHVLGVGWAAPAGADGPGDHRAGEPGGAHQALDAGHVP